MVDGASYLQRVLRITLPLTARTILLVTLFSVIGSLLAFDQFFLMTAGQPFNKTASSVFWLYLNSFPVPETRLRRGALAHPGGDRPRLHGGADVAHPQDSCLSPIGSPTKGTEVSAEYTLAASPAKGAARSLVAAGTERPHQISGRGALVALSVDHAGAARPDGAGVAEVDHRAGGDSADLFHPRSSASTAMPSCGTIRTDCRPISSTAPQRRFSTIAFCLVLTIPAGYALARFPIPGKEFFFVFLLLALIIPYQALITPIFFMFATLRLTQHSGWPRHHPHRHPRPVQHLHHAQQLRGGAARTRRGRGDRRMLELAGADPHLPAGDPAGDRDGVAVRVRHLVERVPRRPRRS